MSERMMAAVAAVIAATQGDGDDPAQIARQPGAGYGLRIIAGKMTGQPSLMNARAGRSRPEVNTPVRRAQGGGERNRIRGGIGARRHGVDGHRGRRDLRHRDAGCPSRPSHGEPAGARRRSPAPFRPTFPGRKLSRWRLRKAKEVVEGQVILIP